MLAQLEKPTNDFFALASYLIHGRDRPPNPNRVAWVLPHNLPTDDPMIAAEYMTATSELSKRCRKACYHAIIAWAHDEHPSPEIMQEIAVKTLTLAGLAEHQALVMGHGDKEHAHLHMMINRVHPETGRAWSTSHDYRRFDRIMKLLADEYGFQYVPPHIFEPDLTDALPMAPNSNARYAAKRGADTGRPQWSRAAARNLGDRLSEPFDMATSWDDVEYALAEHGLTLEAKGSGFIVGNAAGYAKLSALGLTASAKGRARRLAGSYQVRRSTRRPPTRRPWWEIDAIDVARAIGSRDDVREAVQDTRARRLGRRARFGLFKQLMAELDEQLRAGTYLTPRSAEKPRSARTRSTIHYRRSGR